MRGKPKDGSKNPGGRPRKILIWKSKDIEGKIFEMASYSLSGDEIASLLGLSRSVLYGNQSYSTALKNGSEHCDASLRRKQYQEAMAGNTTMLVWLGKQRLKQSDKLQHSGPNGGAIPVTFEAASAAMSDFLAVIAERKKDQETSVQ